MVTFKNDISAKYLPWNTTGKNGCFFLLVHCGMFPGSVKLESVRKQHTAKLVNVIHGTRNEYVPLHTLPTFCCSPCLDPRVNNSRLTRGRQCRNHRSTQALRERSRRWCPRSGVRWPRSRALTLATSCLHSQLCYTSSDWKEGVRGHTMTSLWLACSSIQLCTKRVC